MKVTFQIHPDEFDEAIVNRLQEIYIDQITNWHHEPDAAELEDSLLTVIEFFMLQSEYDKWYDTIKEL